MWNKHNATKAMAHGARDSVYALSQHVQICKGDASPHEISLFLNLVKKKSETKAAKRQSALAIHSDISESQSSISSELSLKKRCTIAPYSTPLSPLVSAASNASVFVNCGGGRQPSIQAGFDRGSATIDGCN